jgi:DNA ligase-associated metallophosphoesterase
MQSNPLSGAKRLAHPDTALWLLPEGVVYDQTHRSLFIADVHLGKADTFRRLGVPVPNGSNQRSLERISQLLARYDVAELVFLGDLLHDYLPGSHALYAQLSQWRAQYSDVQMTLVIGNHDRKAGSLPPQCGIESVVSGTVSNGLCLLHEPTLPARHTGEYGLAGHIHPVTRIRSRADSVRVKCFWVQSELLVLPAFGEFTGGYRIQVARSDSVYITDGEVVHRLPNQRENQRAA